MELNESILKRDFSMEFLAKMENEIVMSHYKYGWMSQISPELAHVFQCIKERLELYEKRHNTEYLVDVANFAMIGFKHPSFADSKYTATDSDKSPGLAGGISYKQMIEEME